MIGAKALAVGPRKRVSVYIGQGDFENDCTLSQPPTFYDPRYATPA
jgi:hypothetical protein